MIRQVRMKHRNRILVGKMREQGDWERITREEVAQAIRTFKEKGGLIRELPRQPDEYRAKVGNHLHAAYEPVIEY